MAASLSPDRLVFPIRSSRPESRLAVRTDGPTFSVDFIDAIGEILTPLSDTRRQIVHLSADKTDVESYDLAIYRRFKLWSPACSSDVTSYV